MISAIHGLHRFGLGPRPGDLKGVEDDSRGALAAELDEPDVALLDDEDLLSSVEAYSEAQQIRRAQRERKEAEAEAEMDPPGDMAEPPTDSDDAEREPRKRTPIRRAVEAELAVRIDQILAADFGFVERLVAFWNNHFAVETDTSSLVRILTGPYEREAIRPHVLGRFEDMLFAVTKHQAMLHYLNNATSIGPNSPMGRQRGRGLNENHAREILELHTLGVDGGYSQADVTAFAEILTGWTVNRRVRQPRFGQFAFISRQHEPGARSVMGRRYEDDGIGQGEAVLSDLARHPATAAHIARKLARHFVADEPPATLVDTLTGTFLDTDGDLKALALALIRSDEAWGDSKKLKSPQEFLWSSLRALDVPLEPGPAIRFLRVLGQPLWNPPSPEGFDDRKAVWLAPDAFADRVDIAQELAALADSDSNPSELMDQVIDASTETRSTIDFAQSPTQGFVLLLMSPEFQWR